MDKLELLRTKINADYQSYKQEALAQSKEDLFRQSYRHALCKEWFVYLVEDWLGNIRDGREWRVEEEGEIANALLSLNNILKELVGRTASLDIFEFGDTETLSVILDEVPEWKR